MQEKEKMLKGLLYYADKDETLKKERLECKKLCHLHNQLSPEKLDERKNLIKQILKSTKENFLIEQPFICDYGYNIEIGENFYSNHNLTILDCNNVKFGDNVFVGPNCSFYCALHPLDSKTRNQGLEYSKPITIGNDVWLGGNVVTLAGVTIGNGVVIGAGSVVTKDIPDNVVVAGNPAKIIKKINQNG